jgi:hypothetical protein
LISPSMSVVFPEFDLPTIETIGGIICHPYVFG